MHHTSRKDCTDEEPPYFWVFSLLLSTFFIVSATIHTEDVRPRRNSKSGKRHVLCFKTHTNISNTLFCNWWSTMETNQFDSGQTIIFHSSLYHQYNYLQHIHTSRRHADQKQYVLPIFKHQICFSNRDLNILFSGFPPTIANNFFLY